MREKNWLGGQTLKCPACAFNESFIVRTKAEDEGLVVRTRQCERCGVRWKTGEALIQDLDRAARVLAAARQLQELVGGEA